MEVDATLGKRGYRDQEKNEEAESGEPNKRRRVTTNDGTVIKNESTGWDTEPAPCNN